MTRLIPCNNCDSPELQHKKGDDFLLVFESFTEENEPFDPSTIDLSWIISDNLGVLVTITGDDLTIENSYIQFHKEKDEFEEFTFMGSYTHKLYENTTNNTLFEGKFQLL